MYAAVLWICVRVFDADSGNDICISSTKANISTADFKEIVEEDKYVTKLSSVLTSDFVLC